MQFGKLLLVISIMVGIESESWLSKYGFKAGWPETVLRR